VTVLVTGATGLLGSHLVDLLVERHEPVRVLAKLGDDVSRLVPLGVEICTGDLSDLASLEVAVRGVDRVLHCAARTGPWGPEIEYETINVRRLKALIEVARAAGVQRIVHVSSITVHGNDLGGAADETAPFRVEPNPYSRSKVAGERLLQEMIADQQAPVTIVRPGWIYGPRDVASFARFASMIQRGRMFVIGPGTNHVPLVYARDVAEGILRASASPRAIGRAYLLVNDEPVTQQDYLHAIASELGVSPPKLHIPYRVALALGATAELAGHLAHRRQAPPVMRYGLQLLGGENRFIIHRARTELGFAPQTSLAEGVRLSIAWYRTMPRAPVRRAP
jgi:nucleoside-diphosphate-sugar epimerase